MSASCEGVSPPQCSKKGPLSSEVNSGTPHFLRTESSLTLDEKPAPPAIDPSSSSSEENTNVICKKPVRGPPPSVFSNGCLDVGASLLSRYLRVQRSVKRASTTTFLARINDKIALRLSCSRSESSHFVFRSKSRSNKTSSRQRRSSSQPLRAALRFPVSIVRLSNVPLFTMTKRIMPFAMAASSASSASTRVSFSVQSVQSPPRKRQRPETPSPDNKQHRPPHSQSCPSAVEPLSNVSRGDAFCRVPIQHIEPIACSRASTPHSPVTLFYENTAVDTVPGVERHLLSVPVVAVQDVPVESNAQLPVRSVCSVGASPCAITHTAVTDHIAPPTDVPPSVVMSALSSSCATRDSLDGLDAARKCDSLRAASSRVAAAPDASTLIAATNAPMLPPTSLKPQDLDSAAVVCARVSPSPSANHCMRGTPPPLLRTNSSLPDLPDLPAVSFTSPRDLASVWSASSSHTLDDTAALRAAPLACTAHRTEVTLASPSLSCTGGHWLMSACQAPSCASSVPLPTPTAAGTTDVIAAMSSAFSQPITAASVQTAMRVSYTAPRGRGRRGPVGRPPAKAKGLPAIAPPLASSSDAIATQLSSASPSGGCAEADSAEGVIHEGVGEVDAEFLHAVLRASQLPPSALTLRALVEVMRHADMSARVLGAICASLNALNLPLPDAQVQLGVFLDVQPLLLSLVRVADEDEQQGDAWNVVRVHLDSRRLRLDELPEQPVPTARSRRRAAGGEKDRVKRGDLTLCAAVVAPQRHEGLVGMITSSGHGFYALLMPDGAELMLRAAEFAVFDIGNAEHVCAAATAQCVLLNKGILPHSALRSPDCPATTQTAFASLCALIMFAAPHVYKPHSSLLWRVTAAARLALAPPPPPFDVTNVALVQHALARTMDMPADEFVLSAAPSHSTHNIAALHALPHIDAPLRPLTSSAVPAPAPPAIPAAQTVTCAVPALSLAPSASVRDTVGSGLPRQAPLPARDACTHQPHAARTRVAVAAGTASASLASPITALALPPTARMSSVSTLALPHGVGATPTLSGESCLMHALVAIRDHQDVSATAASHATHTFSSPKPFLAPCTSTAPLPGASLPRPDRCLTPFPPPPSLLSGAALSFPRSPTLTLQALGAPARGANIRLSNAEMSLDVGHRSGSPLPPHTPAPLQGVRLRASHLYPPTHTLTSLNPLLHSSSLAPSSFPLLGSGGSMRPAESSFALPRARPALSRAPSPSTLPSLTTGLRPPVAPTVLLSRSASSTMTGTHRQHTTSPPPLVRSSHSPKHV